MTEGLKYQTMDKKFEEIRIYIKEGDLDGLFISSHASIVYLTGYANFSKDEREAFLIITSKDKYIITDARYSEAVKKNVPDFKLLEISSETPLKKVLGGLAEKLKLKIVGAEEDDLTHREYKSIRKIFGKLKHIEIKKSRSVKTSEEIKLIEKACDFGDEAFEFILKKFQTGISEQELAFELEKFIREKGATLSFETIIAFSENSSVPHHQTGGKKLESGKGQFILLDFGVRYKNYCSDMTRTVIFGKASEKQKEIYETVKDAQKKAVEYINNNLEILRQRVPQDDISGVQDDSGSPTRSALGDDSMGVKAARVDKIAREYIMNKGFPAIPHSLGHGIGLEVHEHPYLSPRSKEVLKEGMVFSIEPGIYIPDFGGVRIEDLFVLGKNGLRQLTKSDKNLIEI